MKETKKDFLFGIALTDNFETKDYADFLKKEYDLTTKEIKELKPAHLFRLSDNVRFWQFDADNVLFSEEKETYYHTGDFEPIEGIKNNEDIVALVDENCELEMI